MQVKIAARTAIDNVLITLLDHVLVCDNEDLINVLSAQVGLMKEEVGGVIDLGLGPEQVEEGTDVSPAAATLALSNEMNSMKKIHKQYLLHRIENWRVQLPFLK